MAPYYSMKEGQRTRSLPTGTFGQISFERLVRLMRDSGEIDARETVTHLDVDAVNGMLRYRLERK